MLIFFLDLHIERPTSLRQMLLSPTVKLFVKRYTVSHSTSILPAAVSGEVGTYLWQVSPSHHDTVRGPLQDLPHTIVKAQRGPVQRAVDLTPVQPRPGKNNTHKTSDNVELSFLRWGNHTAASELEEIVYESKCFRSDEIR